MTGYGRGIAEGDRRRLTVSLRSVNHRFLDLVLRGADDLREVEPLIREQVTQVLRRGRVEAMVTSTTLGNLAEPQVDETVVRALAALGRRMAEAGWIASSRLELGDLLRLPGVVRLEAADEGWSELDRRALVEALEAALTELCEARRTEGSALGRALEQRLDGLEAMLAGLREGQVGLTETLLGGLRRRLSEMLGDAELDPDRLLQEAALLVDKSDISEELDRLGSHLEHFRSILGQAGSVGKRLDFLAQEIFRELNTIGSKGRNSDITREVVEGKVLCEQLREQIQNVE